MTRQSYVYDKELKKVVTREEFNARQDILGQAPMFIPDEMPDTWHPANGNYYSSKSEFRKATRRAGCEEVGDQDMSPKSSDMKNKREEIRHALNENIKRQEENDRRRKYY